jgi:RNA polymerase sigma-70 factor (ECF subfamily)
MNPDLNKLWLELNEDIGRYVCNKVDHQDHCHDILQDVYLKMIANVEKIRNVDNVKAYLLRISSNTIADHYRSSKTKEAVPMPEEQEVKCDTGCSPAISDKFLQEAINELPGKYRDALLRVDFEGMSQKEYADQLGISISGAKSRVQRAREKLKDLILKCCDYQFDKYGNVIKCCGDEIESPGSN